MQVRMKVHVSGTRNGQEWPPRGSVVDLPDAEAADYCRTGMAEPVSTFGADVEIATVSEPELRTDTESGQAIRRGPGRPRKAAASRPQEGEQQA